MFMGRLGKIRGAVVGAALCGLLAEWAVAQPQPGAQPQAGTPSAATSPFRVLVVVNQNSPESLAIGDYYVMRRNIPAANICKIAAPVQEEIQRAVYNDAIAAPVAA